MKIDKWTFLLVSFFISTLRNYYSSSVLYKKMVKVDVFLQELPLNVLLYLQYDIISWLLAFHYEKFVKPLKISYFLKNASHFSSLGIFPSDLKILTWTLRSEAFFHCCFYFSDTEQNWTKCRLFISKLASLVLSKTTVYSLILIFSSQKHFFNLLVRETKKEFF